MLSFIGLVNKFIYYVLYILDKFLKVTNPIRFI